MKQVSHSEDWWAVLALAHLLRCTAHLKKDGARCKREALPGTNVCSSHGGLVPVVQAAAAARIGMCVDEAARALLEMARDPEVEAWVRMKIHQDFLDRGGLGATSKALVSVGPADPVETLFRDLLGRSRRPAGPDLPPPGPGAPPSATTPRKTPTVARLAGDDVVDAELVPEPVVPRQTPTAPRPERRARGRGVSGSPGTPKHIREALERLL